MLVGAYVGFATVGVFCAWYMYDSFLGIDLSGDGHSTVTWHQLRNWESCHTWPDFKVPLYATLSHLCGFLRAIISLPHISPPQEGMLHLLLCRDALPC